MAEDNEIEPVDLGELPASVLPLDKDGRLDEQWAGKLFDKSVYPHSEDIDGWPFDAIDELPFVLNVPKSVPLTYYEGGEPGVGERHVVGTALVNPDGTFTAEMEGGYTLEGDTGLLGPFHGPFSFGRPLLPAEDMEIQIDSGPSASDVDKVMKIFDENGIGSRDL